MSSGATVIPSKTKPRLQQKFKLSHQSRAERLIAAGRVFLAAYALLAILLEPSEPAGYVTFTHAILVVYLAYAVGLAMVTWRFQLPRGRSGVVVHTFDLTVFSIIVFLTRGPTSPFLVFFTFSLVCAALRWESVGTLWTALAGLTAVIAMTLFPTYLLRDPTFERNRFVIQIAYLAVVGMLLAYLASHEQRLRTDLSRLAAWPRTIHADIPALARDLLEHAAEILGTSRAVLAWEEGEEPWLHVASWSEGDLEYSRESPDLFGALVAEPLFGKNFFCPDARSSLATVIYAVPGAAQRWKGAPLHIDLQKRFNIRAAIGLPLSGSNSKGYLFGLDKQGMTPDDLALGGVVAREVAIRLDEFYLLVRLQQHAAAEQRVRLARDLHDGVLQSLTGIALQLETVQRLIQPEPGAAKQRLEEIQELITTEQRELRFHIQALKPIASGLTDPEARLDGRLSELAERIERQWGLHAEVRLSHHDVQIGGPLAQEIYFLVHESLINAARHAGASSVHAELFVEYDQVRIVVVDNGRGFPFRGHVDHAALSEKNLGPVTLRERVASMGGSLTIDSGETGSRIEITVPLAEKGS